MSRWAQGLTRVSVAMTDTPKPITLVLPYYENAGFLQRQITGWAQYPADLRAWFSVIVVDDGSPRPAVLPRVCPVPMRLFRIGVDVPWNWLAARNIGAHHAPPGWLLLTDMDHVLPVETLRSLVFGAHLEAVVYGFSRQESTGQVIEPHSASFLLTRDRFWWTGGYDEALSGHYGTDGEFRRRLAATGPIQILRDVLVRYEHVGDASTARYARKLPADTAAIRQLVAARPKDWRPTVLSFPYEERPC